jgi:hypothetical protein
MYRPVTRLFIALLCAIGLAFAPVAAAAAAAAPNAMPGCTMKGEMPSKPVDHSKMACCTPACQAPTSAALLPDRDRASDLSLGGGDLHASAPAKKLASFAPTGLDPPPRLSA